MKNIAMWFSNLSIMRKVQHIFAVSMVVTILLCTLFFVSITRVKLAHTNSERNADKLNSVQKSYEAVINNVNNISRLITVNDSVLNYLRDERPGDNKTVDDGVRSELYRILNSFSGRYTVFVLKQAEVLDDNPMRMDSEPQEPPKKVLKTYYVNTSIGIISPNLEELFSPRWYGRAASRKGGYIVMPDNSNVFSFNSGIRTVSFIRVVNDIDTQKPLGLLVINIPLSEITETYENFVSDDCIIAYCDSDGYILSSNADDSAIQDLLKRKPQITERDSYHTVSRTRTIDSRKISDTGIYIVCSSKTSFLDEFSQELVIQIIGMLILIIVMLSFISKYINMYITLPVKKLSDIMKVDRKGSSPVTLIDNDNERSDEIGDLYNCYNAMGARINDLLETVVEKEKQRVHAEMIAVQEQMNPHFLYNTLDTIGCMAFQNSPEEVYDAIETLGVFYRKFLSKGSEAITVSDEVTIVQKYIKLLKLRNDAEFTDEYYIEPGLENVMVTKLILQPLVENSIQHGIIPKGEPGVIRISIYSENNRMHIKVYDSGVGMDEYQTAALLKDDNPKSFGFKSTVKRIRSFYQNNAFVSINSKVGEFCEIDINVPCHR